MPRKQYQYHYIYKTTNILNNKFYIGMHSTNDLNDGYQGSGKRLWYSINKHGKENHITEILEYLPDRDSLRLREKEIVNKELINEDLCMNLAVGGQGINGSWEYANSPNYNNPTHSKEHMDRMREKSLNFWNDPIKSQKRKEQMSASMKEAYRMGKRKITCKPLIPGEYKHSAESRQKISKVKKGTCTGKDNSQYGTKWAWINKNGNILKIRRCKINEYLINGWFNGTKSPQDKIKKCKKCGNVKCPRPEICKKTKIINFLIKFIGFNHSTLGSLKFYEEYDRILKMLYTEYHINNKSIRDIGRIFNIEPPHKIHNLFKSIGISCRNQKKALENYYNGN